MSTEKAQKLESQRFRERSVKLAGNGQSVEFRQNGKTCAHLVDQSTFSHKFAEQISNIAELESTIDEAEHHINTLCV